MNDLSDRFTSQGHQASELMWGGVIHSDELSETGSGDKSKAKEKFNFALADCLALELELSYLPEDMANSKISQTVTQDFSLHGTDFKEGNFLIIDYQGGNDFEFDNEKCFFTVSVYNNEAESKLNQTSRGAISDRVGGGAGEIKYITNLCIHELMPALNPDAYKEFMEKYHHYVRFRKIITKKGLYDIDDIGKIEIKTRSRFEQALEWGRRIIS